MSLKSGGQHVRKLLLPAPSTWETVWSALKGVSAVAMQSEDRQALEDMLTAGIINDSVLANSRHNSAASPGGSGSILVFSLFDSLHLNPLWKKHGFDATEFLRGVRPALTNFMELLHQLRADEMKHQRIKQQQQQASVDAAANESNEEQNNDDTITTTTTTTTTQTGTTPAGKNYKNGTEGGIISDEILQMIGAASPKDGTHKNEFSWSALAEKDPDSVAGALSKMTTPDYLDQAYFTTLMDCFLTAHLAAAESATESSSAASSSSPDDDGEDDPVLPEYVVGSTKIREVAILRARAMQLDEPKKDYRYEEFEASDPDFESKQANRPVAAQIDVLFEVTHRYWDDANTAAANIFELNNNDDSNDHNAKDTSDYSSSSSSSSKVLVEQSQLGVAVLEGYLHNPKNLKEGLRWRIPLLREPSEFPNMESYGVKTIVSSSLSDDDDANEEGKSSSNSKK